MVFVNLTYRIYVEEVPDRSTNSDTQQRDRHEVLDDDAKYEGVGAKIN